MDERLAKDEAALLELVEQQGAELVVLARYMQVLTGKCAAAWRAG